MDIHKCITCKHYCLLFNSCNLYYKGLYVGQEDFDIRPISIRDIEESECEYEVKRITNEKHYN